MMRGLSTRLTRLEGRRSTSATDTVARDSADFDNRIAALAARTGTDDADMPHEEIMRREAAFDTAFAAMEVVR